MRKNQANGSDFTFFCINVIPSHRDRVSRNETRQLGSAAAHRHRRGNGLAAIAAAALCELAYGKAGRALVRFQLFNANAADSSELVLCVSEPILYNDLKACNDYSGGFESAANVKCPTLFILGRRDVMTPPRSAQQIVDKIGNAKVVTIEVYGHSLMAEAPDATLDALIQFLC